MIGNFPVDSNYKYIMQSEYSTKKCVFKANFNINTDNEIIKKVLIDFLLSFNKSKEIASKKVKIFIVHFNYSIGDKVLTNVLEFNEQLFETQYYYFQCLENILYSNKDISRKGVFRECLVAFYRNLVDSVYKKYGVKIFSHHFTQAIYLKNFYKFYEAGYSFVYHNQFELPPQNDKVCILPSIQTISNSNSYNDKLMTFDLSKVSEKYRDDVKNFLWYNDGYTRTHISHFNDLAHFLNMKIAYDQLNNNIVRIVRHINKEFSEDFLWEYRSEIEKKVNSGSNLKNILKTLRKFLNHYQKKYNVVKNDLDILSLKKLENFCGGVPITKNDCRLIYNQFTELEKVNKINRIYTIIFEIFLCSNIRIGEILNFTRDCL